MWCIRMKKTFYIISPGALNLFICMYLQLCGILNVHMKYMHTVLRLCLVPSHFLWSWSWFLPILFLSVSPGFRGNRRVGANRIPCRRKRTERWRKCRETREGGREEGVASTDPSVMSCLCGMACDQWRVAWLLSLAAGEHGDAVPQGSVRLQGGRPEDRQGAERWP